MKKQVFQLVVPALLLPGLMFIVRVPTVRAGASKPPVKAQQIVGDWYMGTMSGVDCDLTIRANKTLTVQTGGCFRRDPPIRTTWRLQGDRILLGSPALSTTFGSYLRVARYKNNLVLVPQRTSATQARPYSFHHTFWKNTMKNGLQLPAAAYEAAGVPR